MTHVLAAWSARGTPISPVASPTPTPTISARSVPCPLPGRNDGTCMALVDTAVELQATCKIETCEAVISDEGAEGSWKLVHTIVNNGTDVAIARLSPSSSQAAADLLSRDEVR